MSGYGWLITHDYLEGPQHGCEGVWGPNQTPFSRDDIKHHGRPFLLKDGDGEILYQGLFLGDASSEEGFGPLDDFGEPNAGCTVIEYRNSSGKWEQL